MCSHCYEIGYSKQKCYEIVGYLDWWDFIKKKLLKISKKLMVHLMKVDQVQPTTNVVNPGIVEKFCIFFILKRILYLEPRNFFLS